MATEDRVQDAALSLRRPGVIRRWARRRGPLGLTAVAVIVALLIAAPILALSMSIFAEPGPIWRSVADTVTPRYAFNTLMLAALVAVGVTAIGVPAAWFVTMRDFPGRAAFEVLLILPLAFPAYVIAYAYTDLLDHPGPVQTWLRAVFEFGPRDYWFPEVRSLPGAAIMLILVLYPYVYLLARAAFLNQTAAALDVARTLGAPSRRVFFRVALPMARPAIATGVALTLMETVADFGVVHHFGVQTLATGVYKAWSNYQDPAATSQLAAWLLLFIFLLVGFERAQRGKRRIQDARGGFRAPPRRRLTGRGARLAVMACGLPVLFGFFVPFGMLSWMSAVGGHELFGARYIEYTQNSILLAAAAALVIVAIATLIAYGARLADGPLTRFAALSASMGYAVPGLVLGVALLPIFGAIDVMTSQWPWLSQVLGFELRIMLGTVVGLIIAYTVRFMSVALQTVDASLGKVTPSMDHAARALGHSPMRALRRVHAPMISGGLFTAALIVFVDVLKELPATWILKPDDFQTLATQAYRLASDERLREASTPALAIGVVGLLPVILLAWRIRRSRPGARSGRDG